MNKLFEFYILPLLKKGDIAIIKNSLVIIMFTGLLLMGCGSKDTISPKVTESNPKNGAIDINPSQTEIWVKFDETMTDKSWSWCYENPDMFPQLTGDPSYTEDGTKCILPVKLEPNKEYVIWINTQNNKNFKDKAGNPAEPYKFSFKTK
jgi:hypothetical protein